ncbi:uncharacterized protein [Dysidea avara]|uniref:uncharacterized protein n=1 Tax=Dysidea avara TaxID=196820 RepID=UPI0033225535
MSHKVYPNLAHLDTFPSDLNYTGFVIDGWDHPINLVPIITILVCVMFGGAPRSLLSVWVLINAAFIHLWLDGLIGMTGMGPKYFSDEYAIYDSRFWPTKDPCVTIIALIEVTIMGPLCVLWYIAIGRKLWYRHFLCLVTSTFQLMGTIIYMFCEIWDNFKHLPAKESWPPKFDTYEKLKYFWGVFVGLNPIWILVPISLYFSTWRKMRPSKDKQN